MSELARKIQYTIRCSAIAGLLLLNACQTPAPTPDKPAATAQRPSPPAIAKTPPPDSLPEPPVAMPPTLTRVSWDELPGWAQDNHAEALPALLISCRVVAKQAVWRDVCAAAGAVSGKGHETARRFFEQSFKPYRVSNPDGTLDGLATGYYEPTVRGSRTRSARNRYPVYGAPDDILTIDPSLLAPELKASPPRGRVEGRRVVPYHTRAQIDAENSPLRGREIAWVDDAIDLFFLQVQGSGRIELNEGGVMRIGFADHNGHPYRSIGRVLIERGELSADRASMQGIKAWARTNPTRLNDLLQQNPRYVFFRELTGPATSPPGAMGVPLTPERSVAIDPKYVPLGVPVHVATTWPNTSKPLQRLMLAQDTGGAIRGAVRIDYFWGAGDKAALEAGRMQQSVRMWVLLPNDYPVPEAKP